MTGMATVVGAPVSSADLAFVIDNSRLPNEVIKKFFQLFCELCPASGLLGKKKFHAFYEAVFTDDKKNAFAFYDCLFRAFDEDGSGALDFKEFMQVFDVLLCGTPAEKLDLTFRMCDTDKSGTLELHELKEIIAAMLQLSDLPDADKTALPPMLAAAIMAVVDTDEDGRLTKQEFIDGCLKEAKIYGIITTGLTIEALLIK